MKFISALPRLVALSAIGVVALEVPVAAVDLALNDGRKLTNAWRCRDGSFSAKKTELFSSGIYTWKALDLPERVSDESQSYGVRGNFPATTPT